MKTTMKHSSREIELSLWQCLAIILAIMVGLLAMAPYIGLYRTKKCATLTNEKIIEHQSQKTDASFNDHRRYVRDVNAPDQCSVVPPQCSATTTLTTQSTASTTTTTRSTVSTASITRPIITSYPTQPPVTTPDPWANISRPHNSWRLPTYAKPIDYQLSLNCPLCYQWIDNLPATLFYGKVSINIDILTATQSLVLHAKNLNITVATLVAGTPRTATVTYLPEFEMIYLDFGLPQIAVGPVTVEIEYTGVLNERDNTGFYREYFWKSVGELSYILAANFQPIYARTVFPCFDEPSMRATFTLALEHPQNITVAVSNTRFQLQNETMTIFAQTPIFSTYSFSWTLLPIDEFEFRLRTLSGVDVSIWVRPELMGPSGEFLNSAFDIIEKTITFLQSSLGLTAADFPSKLDIIGVPDLTLDEKASVSFGLLIVREEILSVDKSLDSAERIQSRVKSIADIIIQILFAKTDWWDNIWFGKSLSSYLAYKMAEINYPEYHLMEQFPIREMVPLMMDDFKPSIWPVSNKNLTNNDEILDYLSINVYSKGASLLRLVDYIFGDTQFLQAVKSILPITDVSNILPTFYSQFDLPTVLNTTITTEEFLRSWLEEINYPLVTIDWIPSSPESNITRLTFRQARYYGSYVLDDTGLDLNYLWKVYMECDLGGSYDTNNWDVMDNYAPSRLKFMFDQPNITIELENEEYLWIKCNKNFYSFQVTEYIYKEGNPFDIWGYFEELVPQDRFSSNDLADLINTAFILPHGGEIVNYEQTINLIERLQSNMTLTFVPWSTFVWHWNYLMGVEEHSKYFWNFKQFATRQIYEMYDFDINNVVTEGTTHQDKLIKSLFYELLCRVQNTDALYKATELYYLTPDSYFTDSIGETNVPPEYLSTAIYYHLQNAHALDEWDYIWYTFFDNYNKTAQQRSVILRSLGASKDIWRLKSLLEEASDFYTDLIEGQEYFDILVSMSQNPIGRDVVWNFYRHNYELLVDRFGTNNRLFNQLIASISQSFDNQFYYFQMIEFINDYPSASRFQRLAVDQILINFVWLLDGYAEDLNVAITAADKANSKQK